MIAHSLFAGLRLAHFRPEAQIAELAGWEFMERSWVGEVIGFSEWLRPEGRPDLLQSLAVSFIEFPPEDAEAVLRAIDLPLRAGMTREEVVGVLGEPVKEFRFVENRTTYEFKTPKPSSYDISCTILHEGGLSYLVVMVA